jgi:hypothetical protein
VRAVIFLFVLLTAAAAGAQQQPPSSSQPSGTDSPSEWSKLTESCFSWTGIPSCADELFTGTPFHIAVGSLAPENGFGVGLAYVGHKTTDNWRNTWNADAVASDNGSWRAGAYAQFVHTPNRPVGVSYGPPPPQVKRNLTNLPERTVFGLYAQAISLNELTYFGLGPSTTPAGRAFYGMTQTIAGGNIVKPFYSPLAASLYGEINGRFVDIRERLGQSSPSIGELYTEGTAPGLTTHPATLQLGEGIRIRPVLASDVVRLDYSAVYRQYFAPGGSDFSFQRLTIDLGHEFALYPITTRLWAPRPGNGPDSCLLDPSDDHSECPKPYVRNFEGTIGLRVLAVLSMTPGGNVVPFYFQPTLGGTDINGDPALSSYQDYRFRAPNLLLVRESFEHSVWNLPLGVAFRADEGEVSLSRGGLGNGPWLHSFSGGLTLRAGGFPQVLLLFSWGGSEGTHTSAIMNASLLGGSFRPSLY